MTQNVSSSMYWEACEVLRRAEPYSISTKYLARLLIQYLGEHPQLYHAKMPYYSMGDEAFERLMLLLGPNGHTIAKLWFIQNENQCS